MLPLTKMTPARGEGDSLGESADSTKRWDFNQVYTGSIRGNVSRVTMAHRFTNTIVFPNGMKANTNLNTSESKYRLQDRRDDSKDFSTSLSLSIGSDLLISGNIGDRKSFNRTVSFGGGLQDFTNNSQQASTVLSYTRPVSDALRLNARSSASIQKSEKSFKTDEVRDGRIHGGMSYAQGDRFTISGRAFAGKSSVNSTSGIDENTGLGSDEDSLSTRLKINVIDGSDMEVSYSRFTRSQEFMDLPRGVFSEQQLGGDELVREVETKTAKVLVFKARTNPWRDLDLNFSAEHRDATTDYAIAKKRFNGLVSDILRGDIKYGIGSTKLAVQVENRDVLHDLGPQSVGSFDEKYQQLNLNVSHSFTNTLSASFKTGATLLQNFYVDFDVSPRDRDQLEQFVNARIQSTPFPKISAGVYVSVTKTEFVNIDGSLSQNNREETTYDFRPSISYKMNERVEIKQDYGLNIEFSDFVFKEDDNFLDRNITFSNTITARLSKALDVDLYYSLRLHDRGSYLSPTPASERLLNINQEDRRDEMKINVRYAINSRLTLIGKNDYSQRVDEILGTGRQNKFTDGGIEIGLEGNYKIGGGNTFKFALRKVNRFGRFNREEQEDYWVMDSSIRYTF
jgi:hypothetical protein